MWDHLGINCDFLLVFCADDTGLVCLLLVAFVSSPNDHPFIPHPFNSHGASMTCTFNNVSLSSSVCHVIHPISEREADTHNSQVVNTWTSSEVHNRKEDKVVLRAEMEDHTLTVSVCVLDHYNDRKSHQDCINQNPSSRVQDLNKKFPRALIFHWSGVHKQIGWLTDRRQRK